MRKYFIEYEVSGVTYGRFVKSNTVENALILSGYMDINHIRKGELKILYSEPLLEDLEK